MSAPFKITLLFALLAVAARADDFDLMVESDQVLITVDAQAGARQISAVSRSLEWQIVALGEDRAQVRLRVPIGSFDSGHGAIDQLVREAAGWTRNPKAEIAGEVSGGRFTGTLLVNGIARPVSMPVEVKRAGDQLVVHTRFNIDLRDFGLAVPPLDGSAMVEFVAMLHASPRAAFAGGSWHS